MYCMKKGKFGCQKQKSIKPFFVRIVKTIKLKEK